MSETTEQTVSAEARREEFSQLLKSRAAQIKSVRNDVYTTQWWQMLINFISGAGALALLITSMLTDGTVRIVTTVVGVVLVIFVIVYNYTLRAVTPTSFLQYTYVDKDKTYCFMVLSKTRSAFSDGDNHIEVDRKEVVRLAERTYPKYRYDFFADMDVELHVVKNDTEEFIGKSEVDGKRYKSKIVFKNGVPLYGSVGGGRIKYFDLNDTKNKFVVPVDLKRGAKELNVNFPKVPGLYVRDDIKDMTKQ